MIYLIKLSDLEQIVEEYGKVKLLQEVRTDYVNESKTGIGLCSCLYGRLISLVREMKCYGGGEVVFVNENEVPVRRDLAYTRIFPQWHRDGAWNLTYIPDIIYHPDWYVCGYWWPHSDCGARLEFLDKLIDIYKRNGGLR